MSELSKTDQMWLKDKVGIIQNLSRATAMNLIHMGRHLSEVRERIPNFCDWVRQEFTFGVATAYKLCRVAKQMGPLVDGNANIDATALYMLSEPRTSDQARTIAAQIANDGQRVTPDLAREIIAGDRISKSDEDRHAKIYERRRKQEDPEPKEVKDLTKDFRHLWMALTSILAKSNQIIISKITDLEDDQPAAASSGNGTHDRAAFLPLSLTYYPNEAGVSPKNFITSENLEVLMIQASNTEPRKRCKGCRAELGMYTDFSKKGATGFGRCAKCKRCERKRVSKAKAEYCRKRKAATAHISPYYDDAD